MPVAPFDAALSISSSAGRNGIPASRARNGISLLFLFKHAALRAAQSPEAEAKPVAVAPKSTAENKPINAPSTGLLSRLRSRLRNLMAVYDANVDLISIGAYKSGTNPVLDEAIARIDRINALLQQKVDEKYTYEQTVQLMIETAR